MLTYVENALQSKLKNVLEQNNNIESSLEKLHSKISDVVEHSNDLKLKIDALENKHRQSSTDLNQLEQYSRRNSLYLCDIPETSERKNKNDCIWSIAETNIGLTIHENDIDRSQRLGQHRNNKMPEPIIAMFARHNIREKVIKSRRTLKGTLACLFAKA